MARKPEPRQEYTFEEEKKILDYIMAKQEFNFLRGNVFWQEMEQEEIVNKTWQSVKEHFRRKLIDKLHLFKLDPNDLKKLRAGWFKTSQAEKYENTLTIEIPNPETFEILSSVDESVQEVVSITSDKPKSDASSPDLLFERPQAEKTLKDLKIERILKKYTNFLGTDKVSADLGESFGPRRKPPKTTTNSTVENQKENQMSKYAESEQFSKKEDEHLLNFVVENKSCWQNLKNIAVYEFYKDLHESLRSPEEIRNRFLNHILPNVDVQKLKESGVDLPKIINQEQDKTAQPKTSEIALQTGTDDSIKEQKHSVYARLFFNEKDHIFASTTQENQDEVRKIIIRKYKISPENFHPVNFDSNEISNKVGDFLKRLFNDYEQFIKEHLDDKEIDVDYIISNLKIYDQPLFWYGESLDENVEESQMEIDEVPEESNMNVDNNVDIFDEHSNLMANLQIVIKLENPSPTQDQE